MRSFQEEYQFHLVSVQTKRKAALIHRSKMLAADDANGSHGSEDKEFPQCNKSGFLQEMGTMLREYRILSTGSPLRQGQVERNHAVVVPAGLSEGQSFRLKILNLGDVMVEVPKGAAGGSTLNVVIPAAPGRSDWDWDLQLAIRSGDSLVVMEIMHQHFHSSKVFTEACNSLVRVVEAEESNKRRSEFLDLRAIEMITQGSHEHNKEEPAVVAGAQALSALFFDSFNSTIAGAKAGAGRLLLDNLVLHMESAAVREFSLAALCNLCATAEGCQSLKDSQRSPKYTKYSVDILIEAMIRSQDAHTAKKLMCIDIDSFTLTAPIRSWNMAASYCLEWFKAMHFC
uniref:Uncharacterized protein n=2 Tax=Guillardia theta TaxID=55529 RepID=A0A7S4P463_GUITH